MKLFNKIALFALAAFAFNACEDVPAPYTLPGEGTGGSTMPEGIYIDEKFSTGFGVFTPVETEGSFPWVIDYNTAKATSYDGAKDNAAQSWLVSDPVDFTEETEAYVAFDYIIRYSESGKVAANHQLLISADYAGDPAAATWINVPYNAVEGIDWSTFYNASVAVPAEFMGKANVVFALKYTAKSKAGTWEVKNFIVAHGTPSEPQEPEEAGSYTVSEAIEAFTSGKGGPAVITGYIVGTIDGQVYSEGCKFSGTATTQTNLLIADNADETNSSNCMPVQLPSGDVRKALNLVDNPQLYKKKVSLTGSLEKYFGVPGLKSVTKYEIDGVTPDEPETPTDAYVNETFASDFGTFSTQETEGNSPWVIDYSCAKATGYYDSDGDGKGDANAAAQSWLISSAIDFTNESEAYISFDYVIRYTEEGKVADYNQLLISADYTGDAATASWTAISYNPKENSVNWDFSKSGKIAIPTDFLGKKDIRIAFKYTSTEKKAGTWEVKNVVVAHGTADDPDSPEEPEEPEAASKYTVSEAIAAFANGTSGPAIVTGYIVGTVDGQAYSSGCNFSGTATTQTNLLIADNADETDHTKCMPVQLPSGDVRSALNLVDNPGHYKKLATLTGSLEKYFGIAGLKSVTAYELSGESPEEPEEPETPEEPEEPEEPETPEGVSTIADAIAAGAGADVTVQGTIVATYARGFLVNDGTASILVYLGEDKGYNAGDVVKVSGALSEYAGLLQFGNTSAVEKVGTATVSHPEVIEMDGAAMDAYLTAPSVKYISYKGTLEISGNYYNVKVAGASTAVGSLSYPNSGLVDASYNGKEIIVTGYAIGVSRSEFVNTMAVKVELSGNGGSTEEPEEPDTPDTPAGEAVVFDFTNPEALTPSVTPSADASTGVEFESVTFTNGNISIKLEKGSASYGARIWTKTDGTYELRAYNGSTMVISSADGSDISSIVLEGKKITTLSPDSGKLDAGTWSGSASSVTFSVSGTLNMTTITVK